jgi:hypothetical protein
MHQLLISNVSHSDGGVSTFFEQAYHNVGAGGADDEVDALRVQFDTGNITSGVVRLYGLKG